MSDAVAPLLGHRLPDFARGRGRHRLAHRHAADTQLTVVTGVRYGFNPELQEMFKKERHFARVGLGMVIAGSCFQFLAAML